MFSIINICWLQDSEDKPNVIKVITTIITFTGPEIFLKDYKF